ncbi:hypothetical protein BU15DRAFT_66644 [Melanogaster broomeanus]|nr:hypothetical protein BU15DRAFT_66644 [Melanogaster broomeanus]
MDESREELGTRHRSILISPTNAAVIHRSFPACSSLRTPFARNPQYDWASMHWQHNQGAVDAGVQISLSFILWIDLALSTDNGAGEALGARRGALIRQTHTPAIDKGGCSIGLFLVILTGGGQNLGASPGLKMQETTGPGQTSDSKLFVISPLFLLSPICFLSQDRNVLAEMARPFRFILSTSCQHSRDSALCCVPWWNHALLELDSMLPYSEDLEPRTVLKAIQGANQISQQSAVPPSLTPLTPTLTSAAAPLPARALPTPAPAGTTLPTTSATALLLAPAPPMLTSDTPPHRGGIKPAWLSRIVTRYAGVRRAGNDLVHPAGAAISGWRECRTPPSPRTRELHCKSSSDEDISIQNSKLLYIAEISSSERRRAYYPSSHTFSGPMGKSVASLVPELQYIVLVRVLKSADIQGHLRCLDDLMDPTIRSTQLSLNIYQPGNQGLGTPQQSASYHALEWRETSAVKLRLEEYRTSHCFGSTYIGLSSHEAKPRHVSDGQHAYKLLLRARTDRFKALLHLPRLLCYRSRIPILYRMKSKETPGTLIRGCTGPGSLRITHTDGHRETSIIAQFDYRSDELTEIFPETLEHACGGAMRDPWEGGVSGRSLLAVLWKSHYPEKF